MTTDTDTPTTSTRNGRRAVQPSQETGEGGSRAGQGYEGDPKTMVLERESFALLCKSLHNMTNEHTKQGQHIEELKQMVYQLGQNQQSLEQDIRRLAGGGTHSNLHGPASGGLGDEEQPLILRKHLADRLTG